MVTFDLRTRHGCYSGASIHPGFYPKANDNDPDLIGWNVHTAQGEPIGQPTVNLWNPPVFPSKGCVFIKITPEFDGWLDSLVAAGLVEDMGVVHPAGFVERYATECRVLNPALLNVG